MADLPTSPTLLGRLRDQPNDAGSWERLLAIYEPWLRKKLRHQASHTTDEDASDIIQNTFCVVLKRVQEFQHNQRTGAFRAWLKAILVNCLRDYQKRRRPETGDFSLQLAALEAPESDLSREWDEEHDQYVLRRLLELVTQHFSEHHVQAFRRTFIEGRRPAEVAVELGLPKHVVWSARSRILAWLRAEARELIDDTRLVPHGA